MAQNPWYTIVDPDTTFPIGLYGIWTDVENDPPYQNPPIMLNDIAWGIEQYAYNHIGANYVLCYIWDTHEDSLAFRLPSGYKMDFGWPPYYGMTWPPDETIHAWLRLGTKQEKIIDNQPESGPDIWQRDHLSDPDEPNMAEQDSATLNLIRWRPHTPKHVTDTATWRWRWWKNKVDTCFDRIRQRCNNWSDVFLTIQANEEENLYPPDTLTGMPDSVQVKVQETAYKYVSDKFKQLFPDVRKKLYIGGGANIGNFRLSDFLDRVQPRLYAYEPGYVFRRHDGAIDSAIQASEINALTDSLAIARVIFKHRPVEMWAVLQAHESNTDNTRRPDSSELRVEANLAMCNGAKGIVWYHFGSWDRGDTWDLGLVDPINRHPYDALDWVGTVNNEIKQIGPTLRQLCIRDGIKNTTAAFYPNSANIGKIVGDRAVAGTFKKFYSDGDSTDYVMLVNRRLNDANGNLTAPLAISMNVTGPPSFIRDVRNGMVSFGTAYGYDSTVFIDTLVPGGGELYHLKRTLEGNESDWERRLHELEIVTDAYLIDSGKTVTATPGTTIIFQPGNHIFVRTNGSLVIDSGAFIDITGGILECEKGSSIIVKDSRGIRGKGMIRNGIIEWTKNWVVGENDSIGFCNGADLNFSCDPKADSSVHILGIVTFASESLGPPEFPYVYTFGDCIDSIVVGEWGGNTLARMESLDSVTLRHIPTIWCRTGATLLSSGSAPSPASPAGSHWMFRNLAKCLVTGTLEASFTEFGMSDSAASPDMGWAGIVAAYGNSKISLDECLIRQIRTTYDSSGYAVHVYASPNTDNIVKRTRILRDSVAEHNILGNAVFVQADSQVDSYLKLECCEIENGWMAGVTCANFNANSTVEMLRNRIDGNAIGVEVFCPGSIGYLQENTIRYAKELDVGWLTGVGISSYFATIYLGDDNLGQTRGMNLIANNEARQISITDGAFLHADGSDSVGSSERPNAVIDDAKGPWRLWEEVNSWATALNNWWGVVPDDQMGGLPCFKPSTFDSLFHCDGTSMFDYIPPLSDSAGCMPGECVLESRTIFPFEFFTKQGSAAAPTIASSPADYPALAGEGNFYEIYRHLASVFANPSASSVNPLTALNAVLHTEAAHVREYPDSAQRISDRMSQFINNRYATVSASMRPGLLSTLAHIHSITGDLTSSDAVIAQLRSQFPSDRLTKNALLLSLQNALAREDTISGNAAIAAMASCGATADVQRIAVLLKYGYLRVPRRSMVAAVSRKTGTRSSSGHDGSFGIGANTIEVSSNPEPFSTKTTIRYRLKEDATIRLVVYSLLGKEIAVLKDGYETAGSHTAVFHASPFLPSGTYLYVLTTETGRASGIMRLVR